MIVFLWILLIKLKLNEDIDRFCVKLNMPEMWFIENVRQKENRMIMIRFFNLQYAYAGEPSMKGFCD